MSSLCLLLGYTRQAFYGHQKNLMREVFEEELIIQEVLKHRVLQPRIGTRKLVIMLKDFTELHQINLGRDAIFSFLRRPLTCDYSLLINNFESSFEN